MSETQPSRSIFISYRRDDAGGEAGRLFDDLTRAFGADTVFMDVTGIQPGIDFRKAIDANVAAAGVLLAIIGPTWLTISDSHGAHRLDDSNDFVRLEIASALARNIPVIPVLVHAATMPHADSLPDDLKDLAYRNAVELTLARWNSDVALLVEALKSYVHVRPGAASQTVHASVPVQLPAPESPDTNRKPPRSKLPWVIGAVAAVLLIATPIILYFLTRTSAPITQFEVPLPYNATGIYADGATFAQTSGVDGAGNAFHPFTNLIAPGTQIMTLHDGTQFLIGPTGANDFLIPSSAQSSISLPTHQRYTGMVILGASVGGSAPAQDFSVVYPGHTGQHVLGMSDWANHQQPFQFETTVLTQTYVNTFAGAKQPGQYSLYEYRLTIDPTQDLERIILPNNQKLAIFAITLKP